MMAKRKNDSVPAEDYVSQLKWRSRYGWMPVRFEPKWKYKIVYRYPPLTLLDRAVRISTVVGMILLIVYLVGSDALTEEVGARVFLGIVFGLIFSILFFAVKDASRIDDENDNEN
jgi:hypothetical protein